MAEQFYTILTAIGKAKVANSGALGTKVNFVKFKVGDGNGSYYNPTENQTELKNQVWEGNISSIYIDEENSNWIVIEAVIPTLVGGFTIREAGVFDDEGNLIAIGKYPETYKPVSSDGSTKDLLMRMILEVSNAENINLKVDPTIILATKKDIQVLESKFDKKIEEINAHLNDMMYETAGGTGTAITLSMQPLKNGYYKKFIASEDNGGVATTVNGKPLYKVCTTNSPKLKKDRPYEIYYNLTGDCFFLKASATGTTSADKVLAGETFSTENDTDLVGTMPNNPAQTNAISIGTNNNNAYVRIPKGAYINDVGNGNSEIVTPYSMIANAVGVNTSYILNNYSVLGIKGSVSKCANIGSPDGSGFDQLIGGNAANDTVGRLDFRNIPRQYIEGDMTVHIKDLLPQNIVAGVKIGGTNGILGTARKLQNYAEGVYNSGMTDTNKYAAFDPNIIPISFDFVLGTSVIKIYDTNNNFYKEVTLDHNIFYINNQMYFTYWTGRSNNGYEYVSVNNIANSKIIIADTYSEGIKNYKRNVTFTWKAFKVR